MIALLVVSREAVYAPHQVPESVFDVFSQCRPALITLSKLFIASSTYIPVCN